MYFITLIFPRSMHSLPSFLTVFLCHDNQVLSSENRYPSRIHCFRALLKSMLFGFNGMNSFPVRIKLDLVMRLSPVSAKNYFRCKSGK